MRTIFPSLPLLILLLALAAHGQEEKKRLAILNTEDNGEPSLEFTDLTYLTDRLREIAVKMLPNDKYSVMSVQSIIDKMGSKENARKMCKEAQCMAEIGRKISAAYVGQARLGRFGGNLTISMELYNSGSGVLIGSFTGESKNVSGLLAVLNKEAPQMFGNMPGVVYVPEAEPTPVPVQEDVVPKFEKPIKTSFWVAIGLEVLGAAIIYAGYTKDKDMAEALDKYKVGKQSDYYYDNAWKDAKDSQGSRNMLYGIGGVFLVSGVGLHIWF
ncbi:MAG: hypothetical protein LBC75_13055 [Fibromonadaceae bacterium]|jgi:hypothetical protein|nr:hypothetical protein [Fibromonadaceae bacterium]